MRLRQQWYSVLAISFVLLGVILTACSGGALTPPATPTPSLQILEKATQEPVLFVHGINPDNGGTHCNGYTTWGDAGQVLDGSIGTYPVFGQILNWHSNDLITIGYYSKDFSDCDVQLAPNNPNRLQDGSNPFDDVSDVLPDIEKNCGVSNNYYVDNNTPIERLSCMVAWYIYDKFSHQGQNVRVVTHSMGGLIIRYALYASGKGCVLPSNLVHTTTCLTFPPELQISNIVTIDAPHGGTLSDVCRTINILDTCFEGEEMIAGYDFMNTLGNDAAQSPPGLGGTLWMLMGSNCFIGGCSEGSIDSVSHTRYMAKAWLKVLYTCDPDLAEPAPAPDPTPASGPVPEPSPTPGPGNTTCYGHGDFLTDSTPYWGDNVLDYNDPNHMGTSVKFCTYCQKGDDGPNDRYNMPHSLYMMKYGLLGIDPRNDPYQGRLSATPTPTASPTPIPTLTSTPTPNSQPGTKILTYPNAANSVAWSPDGTKIASATTVGGSIGIVYVWDTTTGTTILTHQQNEGSASGVLSVAWSPNGKEIASAAATKTVDVWDATTGNTILTYTSNSYPFTVAWSPDGKEIATGNGDGTVQVFDATTDSTLVTYQATYNNENLGEVYSVAWSPNGQEIALGVEGGPESNVVKVFNITTGNTILTYTGHSNIVLSVAWSPDGKEIASGSGDCTVQVWDATTGKTLVTYTGHIDMVTSVAWSPDSKEVASGGWDGTVQVFNAATGSKILAYRQHLLAQMTDHLSSVAWSPDGTKIASSDDFGVDVWQAP